MLRWEKSGSIDGAAQAHRFEKLVCKLLQFWPQSIQFFDDSLLKEEEVQEQLQTVLKLDRGLLKVVNCIREQHCLVHHGHYLGD